MTRLAVGEGEAYVPIVQRSHAIWRELEDATGATLFHRTGGLIMGPQDGTQDHHGKPDFVRRTIDNARRFAIPHEVLRAGEVAKRYPQFLVRGDELAYFEADSGVLLPERCIDAQLGQARTLGARVRFDEKVLAIEEHGGTTTVRTAAGTYSAAKVIVTAGAWIPQMTTGAVRANLRVLRQTLHWFGTSDPGLYGPQRCPIFIWMHGDGPEDPMYGFPMVDGKQGVKVAGEQYRSVSPPDDYAREVTDAESAHMYDAHVAGRLRAVTRNTVHRAACLYTVSTDSGFIVDTYRDMESVTVVSACSGHGFKHSAGLGESLARATVGERVAELEPFTARRFG
ncbi:MAG: N-methyl-L-tryptophan oxidase [Janthinobacterium lividum]